MSNAALARAPHTAALDIHPIAGRIGAEIRGVTLSADLDAATIDAIQAALVQYKVIFFRNQTQLDDQSQEAFAKRLGEPIAHPTVPVVDGTNYLLQLDGAEGQRANSRHTDVTFVEAYPKASILRSVVAPALVATLSGPTPQRLTKACPSRCASLPTSSGRCTATNTTMPVPSPMWTRPSLSAIARCSLPRCTRPNIQWCGCIRSVAKGPCSWGISSSASKVIHRRTRRTCSICCKGM